MPLSTEKGLIYDVDASPKIELHRLPTPMPTPPTPDRPGKLPQTGQLWWPAGLCGALGLCLLALGLVRRGRQR